MPYMGHKYGLGPFLVALLHLKFSATFWDKNILATFEGWQSVAVKS